MTPLLAAPAVAGAVMLLLATAGHARDLGGLRAVLRAQGTARAGLLAGLLVAAELAVGAAVLAALVLPPAAVPALAAQAALYAAFAVQTARLSRRLPTVPCGCVAGRTEPASPVVAVRAAAVGALTAAAAVAAAVAPAPVTAAAAGTALAAGTVLALLLWLLPDALRAPARPSIPVRSA